MTENKELCSLIYMSRWKTYQDFMDEAIKRAGGQSQLARAVSAQLPKGRSIKPQTIQYLQRRSNKPAVGSKYTHLIAAVAQIDAYFSPNEPTNEVAQSPGTLYRADPAPAGILERTREIDGVEFTKDALLVAKAFMELPGNIRQEFKRQIETKAMEYSAFKVDGELGHLAAPTAPSAKLARKKRSSGTH